VLAAFDKTLRNSPDITDECQAQATKIEQGKNESQRNYLLSCARGEKLKKLASNLCKNKKSDGGESGGQWDMEQVLRVYGDYSKCGKLPCWPKTYSRIDKCCIQSGDDSQRLVNCLRSKRPTNLEEVIVTDSRLSERIYNYTKAKGDPIKSALEMGSGKGNWVLSLGRAGVETVVGVEPAYMGSLAFYEDSWDVRYAPVQLDSFLGDGGDGDLQVDAFKCQRFGSKDYKFDLVWTMEVFEHIPMFMHCHLLNKLAASSRKWAFVSIAHPRQRGRGHISTREKADFRLEWERRGFQEVKDEEVRSIVHGALYQCHRDNSMLLERVKPAVNVDCPPRRHGPWAWNPAD